MVINGQSPLPPLPPLEMIPEVDDSNMSTIVSTFDEACLAFDNSTEETDGVVYVGAIAVFIQLIRVLVINLSLPSVEYTKRVRSHLSEADNKEVSDRVRWQ
jgi:hypothetical protein